MVIVFYVLRSCLYTEVVYILWFTVSVTFLLSFLFFNAFLLPTDRSQQELEPAFERVYYTASFAPDAGDPAVPALHGSAASVGGLQRLATG